MSLPINLELPDGFLDEEVRCGYTVTSEMKKVWAVELDLLVQIKKICEKYNLTYYVDGGTLLGAVRHKGFVPWDDDIDVVMFRKDYDRFISVAQVELKHPYFLQTPYTDECYFRRHIQLRNSETTGILYEELNMKKPFNQGIFIDILPLDNIPNKDNKLRLQSKELSIIQKIIRIIYKEHFDNITKEFISKLFKIVGANLFVSFYDKICKRYNKKHTERVSYVSFALGKERNNWQRDWYRDKVFMPFEFLNISAPIGFDPLLKKTYGDYMKFVPNTSSHGEVFFDTENSYTKYLE